MNQQSTSIAEVADSTAIIDSTASTNCTGPSTDSQSPFTSSMDTDTDSAADSAVVTADSGSSSDTDMTLVELRKPKLKRRKRLATGEIVPFDYDESNGPPVQSDDSNLPIQSNDSNPPVVKPVNSSPAASSENSNNSNPAAAAESYPVALDPTGEGLHYETNAVCDKNTPLASEEVSICLKDEVGTNFSCLKIALTLTVNVACRYSYSIAITVESFHSYKHPKTVLLLWDCPEFSLV